MDAVNLSQSVCHDQRVKFVTTHVLCLNDKELVHEKTFKQLFQIE